MDKINEQFKFIIYCVCLGISLVVYAHANFTTVKQTDRLENKLSSTASVNDVTRLEGKLDIIISYLLERK